MIYLNSSKAQEIFDSQDTLATAMASRVHTFMISDEMRSLNPIRPVKPLDKCYLFFSLARAVGTFAHRAVYTGLEANYRVLPFGQPDLSLEEWQVFPFVSSGLGAIYLSQVHADSSVDGIEFDLGFACAVACRSFDDQAIKTFLTGGSKVKNASLDNYDQWLDGFFTN